MATLSKCGAGTRTHATQCQEAWVAGDSQPHNSVPAHAESINEKCGLGRSLRGPGTMVYNTQMSERRLEPGSGGVSAPLPVAL